MKKLISIILSVAMVICMIPFTALTAYAAPSSKQLSTSVAAASSYYIYDLWAEDECFYFDSVEEALDYVNQNPNCDTVTLLKDIDIDEPIIFNDANPEGNSDYLFFELDGHNITANNGDALVLNNLARYVFVDYYQSAYDKGDFVSGYGSIKAEGYAINANTNLSKNILVEGGTFYSATMDSPFFATAGKIKVALRHCAIIAGTNTLVTNNISIGTNGNVYLQDSNGTNPSTSRHMTTTTVGEDTVYIVGDHDFQTSTESIAPDRQSATMSSKCNDCGYINESYPADALIGDTAYSSFKEAFNTVGNGETATIEVLKDCNITSINVDNGKDITLELNGHTLTQNSGYIIPTGGHLTIKNGIINSNSNNVFVLKGIDDSTATDYTNLAIDNMTINSTYPGGAIMLIDNPLTNWSKPDNCYGINVSIKDSVMTCDGVALINNGNYDNIDNPMHIDITNSKLTSSSALAMYIAGYAIVNSTATEYVGSESGVEIRSGVLNILGNENVFTTTYEGEFEAVSNNNGTTTSGAALAVAQHNLSPKPNPVEVNIYGGEFNGIIALNEAMVENIKPQYVDVNINIYDGEFNGTEKAVNSDTCTGFISGGKYSIDPAEEFIATGLSTRLDENDMYVLTNLDYTAYRAAVKVAKSIDRSVYTDASLAALDDTIVAEYTLNTQQDIDSATSLVETRYAELVYKSYNVTFIIEKGNGETESDTQSHSYNDEITLDVSYIDEDVYKWTVDQLGSVKKLPTDAKKVTLVVKGDTTVTVYTKEDVSVAEGLTKITYLSHKDKTIGIDYVSDIDDSTPPETPEIPFYDFTGWVKVDDTTFKATYHYNSGYCRFIGGMNVVIENNGNVSTNNDDGINVPYDDIINVSSSAEGQLALSADKEGTKIITYINDVKKIHAPKRETVWLIVLPKVSDATIGVTGGYVRFEDDNFKKVAVNGQYYLPSGCTMVDTGAVLCNKDGDFAIGGAGVVRLVSTMQSSSNEFTVALTTKYGTMSTIYARTYLTYKTSNGETKTIYSNVKAISLLTQGNIE